VKDQIVDLVGCKREDILSASGKTGLLGVDKMLEAIVERVPAPKGDPKHRCKRSSSTVSSIFRGIIAYFRVMNGTIRKGDKVKFFNTGVVYLCCDEVGVLKMDLRPSRK
jgi:GTP-binding protein LepA